MTLFLIFAVSVLAIAVLSLMLRIAAVENKIRKQEGMGDE